MIDDEIAPRSVSGPAVSQPRLVPKVEQLMSGSTKEILIIGSGSGSGSVPGNINRSRSFWSASMSVAQYGSRHRLLGHGAVVGAFALSNLR